MNGLLSSVGLKRLCVRGTTNLEKVIPNIPKGTSFKDWTLSDFLISIKMLGYSRPIYLDTNTLMFGIHNDVYEAEVTTNLLGETLSRKQFDIKVTECVFNEAFNLYEESRKGVVDDKFKRSKTTIMFGQSIIASSVGKHFKVEGAGKQSMCDPELHRLAVEGNMVITADRALYENIRDDTNIKGAAVHVFTGDCSPKGIQTIARTLQLNKDPRNEYFESAYRLAKAMRKHATVTQFLAIISTLGKGLGISKLIINDVEVNLKSEANGKFKVIPLD